MAKSSRQHDVSFFSILKINSVYDNEINVRKKPIMPKDDSAMLNTSAIRVFGFHKKY